jgi:DNA replication protein DnaC
MTQVSVMLAEVLNPQKASPENSPTSEQLSASDQNIEPRYLARIGIPEMYLLAEMGDFEREVQDRIRGCTDDGGVFISGPTGTGKTYLAAAMLRRLTGCNLLGKGGDYWAEGYLRTTSVFISLPDLLGSIQATFGADSNSESIIKAYEKQKVLCIDDFGSEKVSEWSFSIIYRILSHRINYQLFTIITSNLTLEEIHKMEPRIASRLAGFRVIILEGQDRRLKKE